MKNHRRNPRVRHSAAGHRRRQVPADRLGEVSKPSRRAGRWCRGTSSAGSGIDPGDAVRPRSRDAARPARRSPPSPARSRFRSPGATIGSGFAYHAFGVPVSATDLIAGCFIPLLQPLADLLGALLGLLPDVLSPRTRVPPHAAILSPVGRSPDPGIVRSFLKASLCSFCGSGFPLSGHARRGPSGKPFDATVVPHAWSGGTQ